MKILVIANANSPDCRDFDQAATLATAKNAVIEVYVGDAETAVPPDCAGSTDELEFREVRRDRVLDVLNEATAPLRKKGLIVTICYEREARRGAGILRHIKNSRPDLLIYRGALIPLWVYEDQEPSTRDLDLAAPAGRAAHHTG